MEELTIDTNLAYNQIAFAMAHDSHTATQNYTDDDSVDKAVDQTQMVSEQLLGGIRAVRISTGTPVASLYKYGRNIIVQHTFAMGLFKDYLTQVVNFLNNNPNEIVTIIDEGDNDSGWTSKEFFEGVAQVYADLMGGTTDQPGTDDTFKVYSPTGDPTAWPTIAQMLKNKQRLVVFMSKAQKDTQYKWILPAYAPAGQIGMNIYEGFMDDPNTFYPIASMKSDRWPTGSVYPALYLFNHYFYTGTEDVHYSDRSLNHLSVGLILIRDVLLAWFYLQDHINFINVDFYQGVRGANSYLIKLVNLLNKYKNFPSGSYLAILREIYEGIFVVPGPYQSQAETGSIKVTLSVTSWDNDRNRLQVSQDITNMNGADAVYVVNGALVIAPAQSDAYLDRYVPNGDYLQLCEDIKVTLSANLWNENGAYQYDEVDITNYTQGIIENNKGKFHVKSWD